MNTRLTIPESIDGVPVKAIGKRALWEDPLLGYVTLPEDWNMLEKMLLVSLIH